MEQVQPGPAAGGKDAAAAGPPGPSGPQSSGPPGTTDRVEPLTPATTLVRTTTHVVLPAYNEAGSLPPLLTRLGALAETGSVLLTVWVVDDGSSDGTADLARARYAGLDVRVVTHAVNLGLGQAVHSGVRAVLADAGDDDVLVVMDADDTHDVALIPLLRQELERGADIAIASRFVAGGDDATAPAFRRALSRGAAALFRIAVPLDGVHDFTSGYRAYRVSLLRRAVGHYGERLVEEQGFACMVELLLKLRHCHPVVVEVPLVLRYDRKQGASKLRLKRTIGQYLKLLARDRLAPPPFRGL
jgi:dolichol-phosphate mannosyltransferase